MSGPLPVIIIILVIIGVGLYFITSGLPGKTSSSLGSLFSHGFPGIVPSVSTGTHHGLVGPVSPPATRISAPARYPDSGSSQVQSASSTIRPEDIPQGFTLAQLSPFFHKVRLEGVSGGTTGQISLAASLNPGETADITGWEITGNYGGEYVPQAVRVYDPLGVNPPTDIVLGPQDIVNIYPRSSPVNLRLNKCVGYLNTVNQFNPSLYSTCPYINRSEIQFFSGECQNYILSLGSCQTADPGNPQIPQNDYSCKDYISKHFSYHACFDAHEGDADFFSHEVRVWAGSNPLDPFHDRALLLDRQGLLVDSYSY